MKRTIYEVIKRAKELGCPSYGHSVKGALNLAKEIYKESFYGVITRKDYIEIRKELNINSPCENAVSEFYIVELFDKYAAKRCLPVFTLEELTKW